MPTVYKGIIIPIVEFPFGAATTCPAPPIAGLIFIGEETWSGLPWIFGTICEEGIALPLSLNAGWRPPAWGGVRRSCLRVPRNRKLF